MLLVNNLGARLASHRQRIDAAVDRVVRSGWLVLGPEVERFERSFAEFHSAAHCLGLANGTDAIELALRAVGIRAGDRVATAANAGGYSTMAILAVGAEPQFMDVDLASRVVTPDQVSAAIAAGSKAVVATHLYGQAVPGIEAIAEECSRHGIPLVEDCAQAHGAKVAGRRVGGFGAVGTFSFYPTKNLGALGDGGAVVTSDASFAERIRRLRQYGWKDKYRIELAGGCNSRLDEMQAAILSELLPFLDASNDSRRRIATKYSRSIRHPDVAAPPEAQPDFVAHLYVVRCPDREALRTHLSREGIATDVHYPVPDHRQAVFGSRFAAVNLEHTQRLASEVLTLPCYPEMQEADVDQVIAAVNRWQR